VERCEELQQFPAQFLAVELATPSRMLASTHTLKLKLPLSSAVNYN